MIALLALSFLARVFTIVAIWTSPARTIWRVTSTFVTACVIVAVPLLGVGLLVARSFVMVLAVPDLWALVAFLLAAALPFVICRFTRPRPRLTAEPSSSAISPLTPVMMAPAVNGGEPQVVYIAQPARTNTCAILALVFGMGGGLLGIVFGHLALSQIRRTGESGHGLAVAGLILGYLGLAGYAAFLGWFLLSL